MWSTKITTPTTKKRKMVIPAAVAVSTDDEQQQQQTITPNKCIVDGSIITVVEAPKKK
jgi:hypothetical protein